MRCVPGPLLGTEEPSVVVRPTSRRERACLPRGKARPATGTRLSQARPPSPVSGTSILYVKEHLEFDLASVSLPSPWLPEEGGGLASPLLPPGGDEAPAHGRKAKSQAGPSRSDTGILWMARGEKGALGLPGVAQRSPKLVSPWNLVHLPLPLCPLPPRPYCVGFRMLPQWLPWRIFFVQEKC